MSISATINPATGTISAPGVTASTLVAASNAQQAGSTTPSTATGTALGSLTSNYSTFLKLLMTQLRNQDPTSPMNTDQFTSELVQFSSVEQQINTNSSLTQLIQLTQSAQLIQSSSMVGHSVAIIGTEMPVVSSKGAIQFTTPAAGPVTVSVYDSNGGHVGDSLVNATAGTNNWAWNAVAGNGATEPDGLYTVAVNSSDSTGTSTPVPFNVVATATGVQKSGSRLQLQLGPLAVDFSAVQKVLN